MHQAFHLTGSIAREFISFGMLLVYNLLNLYLHVYEDLVGEDLHIYMSIKMIMLLVT